jgi:tetratricopeptide (TPR) repeat protein
VPELPVLALETYQPAVREQLKKAYADAQSEPSNADKTGRLGMVFQAYDQYSLSAVCYGRARALAPNSFEWTYYLATVQTSVGENAQAVGTLREALRLRPKYTPALIRLADLLFSMGKLHESEELYRAVITVTPGTAAAYYGLARVQSASGMISAALEGYQKACELAPRFGAAHFAYALLLQQQGRTADAAAHFAASNAHKKDKPEEDDPLMTAVAALKQGAMVHLRRGVALEASGHLSESIAETERSLAIDPKLVQAHINLISLYSRTGQPERAEAQYKAGLALNADRAELHYNFGVLAIEQKKYSEAAKAFERAIAINPMYAEAHNNLGAMLEIEGRLDDAVREYRQALAIRQTFPAAHYRLGRLLLARGEHSALDHFERALSPPTKETPMYTFALAAAHNRSGNRAKAISYARQARDQALALGQAHLAAKIQRDLAMLEHAAKAR